VAHQIPLFDCRIDGSAIDAVLQVLKSGQLASGPNVAELELRLAARIGCGPVVGMGDSTHALALALQLAGVRSGDEVLTLAYNCLQSNAAISQVGAVPVWLDLDPATATVSLSDCDRAVTARSKALVAYHVAGYPAPLSELRAWCDTRNIVLIEDANNALGAMYRGKPVGGVGDFAVFSFYPNRQINALDGAALACPDKEMAGEASRLRRFGIDAGRFRDFAGEIDPGQDVPVIGMSSLLNHVSATLALQGLATIDARLQRSRCNVAQLTASLSGVRGIEPVKWQHDVEPAFWAWLIRCERRDEIMIALKNRGVQCSKLHQPNDRYTGFGAQPRALPGTRQFINEVLAVPCGWWLAKPDIEQIAEELRLALEKSYTRIPLPSTSNITAA
jgi:perosamine synthetase